MARRNRGLQQVVQNFMMGLQVGWQHQDRHEATQARKDAAAATAERWRQQAEYNRQKLGVEQYKAEGSRNQADATAEWMRRRSAGGAAGGAGMSEAGDAFDTKYDLGGGGGGSDEGGDTAVPDVARGGKIQKAAGGGRLGRAMSTAFTGGMGAGIRAADWQDRRDARTTPTAPQVPTITRGPSTPVPQLADGGMTGGTNGPGSGYGVIAAPPVTATQRFQDGGVPRPNILHQGKPRPGVMALGPVVLDPSIGLLRALGGLPMQRPSPRGPGPQPSPRGPGPQPPPEGGNDTGYGGAPPVTSGEPQRDWPTAEAGATAVAPPRARGGGGGYQARGGALGDQRRTTAYDPVADNRDPRNIGVVNEGGGVNQRTYGMAQRGEITMPLPNQQPFRRGGPVHRFADGGKEDGDKDGSYLLNPSGNVPALGFDVGKRGHGYVGGLYNPVDRTVSAEGGYEHRLGDRGARVGVHGNFDKYVGPGGEHERPNFGGGIRLTVPFEKGGPVVRQFQQGGRQPVPYQRGYTPSLAERTNDRNANQQNEGGGAMPPQGAGEPAGDDSGMVAQLDALWRNEAYAAAQANQQAATAQPPTGGRQGGYGPAADVPTGGRQGGYGDAAVDVPPLPERDPEWARRPSPLSMGEDETPARPRTPGMGEDETPARPRTPGMGEDETPAGARRGAPGPSRSGLPTRFTSDDREAAWDWAVNTPGAVGGRRQDRPVGARGPGPQGPPEGGDDTGYAGTPPQRGVAPPTEPPPGSMNQPGRPPTQARPAAPQGPSAGQEEADRLTREYPQGQTSGAPAPGAIATKPPMQPSQQGVSEPQGGYGLAGPGPGISTNNAARDYLGAATTFANWALKDAGPQRKDEATHALYSGKGAADPTEIAALMAAVDPDKKMPLDKRMEAVAKVVHDFHMAKGDVKMAAESAFNVMQFGVGKSREQGAAALKAIQAGDEQGALRELMAGYSWLADKGSASVQDGSIVVTGDDGTVRAQIPLQPGTIQNLAVGMMSGQLGWDAIRRASNVAGGTGAPAQPTQAVNASYPAAGNQPPPAPAGRQPWDEKPERGAQTWPVGTAAQPSPAPAGPAPAPAGIDATPPATRPATAPQSAAPTATRPPSPTSSQTAPAGGSQVSPKKIGLTSAGAGVDVDGNPEKPTAIATSSPTRTTGGKEYVPDAPSRKTTGGEDMSDDEKIHAPLYKDDPFRPPPRTKQGPPEIAAIDKRLAQLEKQHSQLRTQVSNDPLLKQMPAKEAKMRVARKLSELEKRFGEQRRGLVAQRNEFSKEAREDERHEKNVNLKPREWSLNDDKELKTAFKDRTDALEAAKGRDGKLDPDLDAQRKKSVLRYKLTEEERGPLYDVARELARHNKGLTAERAVDHAIVLTSIIPDNKKSRVNYQTGEKALEWRPVDTNAAGGIVVQMHDGTKINVDLNTYKQVMGLFADNWEKYKNVEKTKKDEAVRAAKRDTGLGKRALDMIKDFRAIAP